MIHDVKGAALSEAVFGDNAKGFNFVSWGTGIGGAHAEKNDGQWQLTQLELDHLFIQDQIKIEQELLPGILRYHCAGGWIGRRFCKSIDQISENEWKQVIEDLSRGIHNMQVTNYAARIVFAGKVARKQANRLSAVRQRIAESAYFLPAPEITLSKWGDEAGLIGALGLIKQQLSV